MNKPETIDLTSHEHVAHVLFHAVCQATSPDGHGSPEFTKILEARRANGGTFNNVSLLVDGVEVPVIGPITDIFKQCEAHMEKRAAELALEMVTKAGLDKLRESFERVDYQLKEALIKAGAKFERED